jgi:hypothetical protein
MAAKRKSKTTLRKVRAESAVQVDQQDLEAIALFAPVEVPADGEAAGGEAPGGDAGTGRPPVPKAGPPVRGGRFGGVGRGQGAPQARRYAFRRS